MTETEKLEILARVKEAREALAQWKADARQDYDFVASRQWDQEDKSKLDEEGRPALTFNRTEVFVDAVVGNEINSRMEAKYIPRGMSPDVQVAEILNGASKWVRDGCNAQHEDEDAFRDMAICGIGVVETLMDYEEETDGKIIKARGDPILSWWDPAAKKQCLEDRRYDFYGWWVDKDVAKEMWPDAEFASPTTIWEEDKDPNVNQASLWYEGDDSTRNIRKNQILILKYEAWKRVNYYKALDPSTQKIVEMDEAAYKKASKRYQKMTGQDLEHVRMTKKVYYRAFIAGEEVLEYTKSPVQCFSRQFITGKRDRNRNSWYGLCRVMRDPQKWANKFLSQILAIINSNAKGGVFHESNVFVDQRKAEEQWAMASPLIEVTEGSLSQGKIKERVPPPIPTGLERLMMFSFESLPFVTGINLEALGLADRTQAGVLEQQRKRAAFGILAPLLEGIRRFRKNDAYVTYKFIREFISDGRLVRIVGDTGDVKYVPLTKDYQTYEYDIVVDEAPQSPEFKEKTWEILSQLLPTMMKIGYPIPPEIWQFSPLPSSVSQKWIEQIKQGPQIPDEVKQQMDEMQQVIQKQGEEGAKLKEENLKLRVDHTVDLMKVDQKAQAEQAKMGLKAQEMMMEAGQSRFEALLGAKMKEYEAVLDAQVKLIAEQISARVEKVKARAEVKEKTQEAKTVKEQLAAERVGIQLKDTFDRKFGELTKELSGLKDEVKEVKKPRTGKVKKTKDGYILPSGATVKKTSDGLVIE